jgi:hypothetical protein
MTTERQMRIISVEMTGKPENTGTNIGGITRGIETLLTKREKKKGKEVVSPGIEPRSRV